MSLIGVSIDAFKGKLTENLSPGFIPLFNWKEAFPQCI